MRIKNLAPLAMMWAIVLAACAQEGAQQAQQMEMSAGDMAAAETAVAELRGAWIDAYEAGDAAAVAALYATDASYMPAFEDVSNGRAAIEQALTGEIATMANRQVEAMPSGNGMSGDLFYETGSYTITAEVMGEPYESGGDYLVVCKRQADGSWRITAHISNSDQPPPMAGEMMEGGMMEEGN